MNLFQKVGFVEKKKRIYYSILAINMVAKAKAIFVPMAVP